VDLALARAIRQKIAEGYEGDVKFILELKGIDQVVSYDAACQYSVNVVERFKTYFADVAAIVKEM
jgi:dimeric dUTPase (all-alpha-NTP-PPase superfamily)